MSASNQLAAYLPFILGALLVGGALTGSFVTAARRARLERNVLLPLYAAAAVALFALKVWQHEWLLAAVALLVLIFACGTLYRRLRITTAGESP